MKKIRYFDLGLYQGEEVEMFLQMADSNCYDCEVHGFEAHPVFAQNVAEKYRDDSRVQIHNLAICDKPGRLRLYIESGSGVGNSIFATKNNVESCNFVDVQGVSFVDWLQQNIHDLDQTINILRFNIEGAELMLVKDLVNKQFHHHFALFLGARVGEDIRKVAELKGQYRPYRSLLRQNGIVILPFCRDRVVNVHLEQLIDRLLNGKQIPMLRVRAGIKLRKIASKWAA